VKRGKKKERKGKERKERKNISSFAVVFAYD